MVLVWISRTESWGEMGFTARRWFLETWSSPEHAGHTRARERWGQDLGPIPQGVEEEGEVGRGQQHDVRRRREGDTVGSMGWEGSASAHW